MANRQHRKCQVFHWFLFCILLSRYSARCEWIRIPTHRLWQFIIMSSSLVSFGHRRRCHFVMIWFLCSSAHRALARIIYLLKLSEPTVETECNGKLADTRRTYSVRRLLSWVNVTPIIIIIICVNLWIIYIYIWRMDSKLLLLIQTQIVGASEAKHTHTHICIYCSILVPLNE